MSMRLTLGALPWYWPRAQVHAFYEAAAASAVDVVYLGEVVCGKRHEMRQADWIEIGRTLAAAGKEVVLCGLALPESEGDLRVLRRIAGNGEFRVEANDMGMVRLASQARVPFVIGLHVNVYNPATLRLLAGAGAFRWVAPVELSGAALHGVLAGFGAPIELEVLAYGRLPLALSARCFTARARNRPKDDCGFTCIEDADGILLATQEEAPLFVLNGIETRSALPASLAGVLRDVAAVGATLLRVVPQRLHTFDVVRILRQCADGAIAPAAAEAALAELCGPAAGGYWRGAAGMEPARPPMP